MAILAVGSVALDTIITSAGRHPDRLGGSATYFSLAASRFSSVRLVGAVGKDFPAEGFHTLRHPRIDVGGLVVLPGKTFRWEGRYSDDFASRDTLGLELGVFETFQPQIPAAARKSSCVFLANIDPRVQDLVLSQIERPKLIGIDTIDHWIKNQHDALLKLFRKTDMVFLNEEEARLLTQAGSLKAMGAWIQRHGPSVVIIKQGWYGAIGWAGRAMIWVPAFPVERTIDPTGAGDSFAGGVLGILDRTPRVTVEALRDAMLHGSVIGSFCVEGVGVAGLHRLAPGVFRSRLAALKRIAGVSR